MPSPGTPGGPGCPARPTVPCREKRLCVFLDVFQHEVKGFSRTSFCLKWGRLPLHQEGRSLVVLQVQEVRASLCPPEQERVSYKAFIDIRKNTVNQNIRRKTNKNRRTTIFSVGWTFTFGPGKPTPSDPVSPIRPGGPGSPWDTVWNNYIMRAVKG